MSRKYIRQQNVENFIYPNNVLTQYGVEIVHNINNNSVSGTVTNFTGTTSSATGLTISFNYSWSLNGADPFINEDGDYNILSVHMMDPTALYYKPWRLVYGKYISPNTTNSGSVSVTLLPSQMGISSFSNGTYYFEIRFIGKKSIDPVCQTLVVSTIPVPTPTPTPTPTATPVVPTPTPSPTAGNPYTSGATLNVTDPGWIKYTSRDSGDKYVFIASTGTYTITECAICSSINFGFPFADLANFTVTSCGSSCSSTPAPTPSMSASPTNPIGVYYRMISCQNYQSYYTQQVTLGRFQYGERVQGNAGFFVIQEYQTNQPDNQTIVSKTGASGCP